MKGKIKFYDAKKGFGFVEADDGNSYFVHASNITSGRTSSYLIDNDEVEFEVTQGKKGPQAANIVLTKEAPPKPRTKKQDNADDSE